MEQTGLAGLTRPVGVTLETWQNPEHTRWGMWHLRELTPTHQVRRGAWERPLVEREEPLDLTGVDVELPDGGAATVQRVLDDSHTDGFVIGQDGEVVAEGYAIPEGARTTHALMSITKSLVGCVAMQLFADGVLDPEQPLESVVPELAASGYAGATVRHLLDMSSGVRFREDYADPESDIRRLDDWILGDPLGTGGGLYEFLTTLEAEAEHGSRFVYRSGETDTLGWVCERATGQRMADLISTRLWEPMGAGHDADLMCDHRGTGIHDGGLAATARDLFRFGQLLLDDGAVAGPDGEQRQVVPAAWLRRTWSVDAPARTRFLESPAELMFRGGWYRNQFWLRPSDNGTVLLGMGIFGQLLYVCRRTRTVAVKVSSWPTPQQPQLLQETLRAFDTVSTVLSRRSRRAGGVPGVVSGLSRSSGNRGRD